MDPCGSRLVGSCVGGEVDAEAVGVATDSGSVTRIEEAIRRPMGAIWPRTGPVLIEPSILAHSVDGLHSALQPMHGDGLEPTPTPTPSSRAAPRLCRVGRSLSTCYTLTSISRSQSVDPTNRAGRSLPCLRLNIASDSVAAEQGTPSSTSMSLHVVPRTSREDSTGENQLQRPKRGRPREP